MHSNKRILYCVGIRPIYSISCRVHSGDRVIVIRIYALTTFPETGAALYARTPRYSVNRIRAMTLLYTSIMYVLWTTGGGVLRSRS